MRISKWLIVVVFSVLTLVIPVSVFAQKDLEITHVIIGSGEEALSSGLAGFIYLANNDSLLEIVAQEEQSWVSYGPKFKIGRVEGVIAGSAGHFQGAPWVGPFLSLNVPVFKGISLNMFHRPGLFLWEPKDWKTENDGVKNPEKIFKGYVGGIRINKGPVSFVYAWQNFLDEPWNELPGVIYTAKVRENFSVSGSVTWNNNKRKWMFYISATWEPKRKN